MKKLILIFLLAPFALKAGFDNLQLPGLVQVRTGDWPITLERKIDDRDDTTYSLQFRDETVLTAVVMDTLPFADIRQLKYFKQALTVLKGGHNGDEAKFNNYSIKRAEVKREATWYILRTKWSLTNFQQNEADRMVYAIENF